MFQRNLGPILQNMSNDHSPQLSVHRSFVVQLYVPAAPDAEVWQGRVEHVTSGKRSSFGSLAELAECIEHFLDTAPHKAESE